MKIYPNFRTAIMGCHDTLKNTGRVIETESWQGIKSPIRMFEAFDIAFKCPMPHTIPTLEDEIKPNLPWAFDHFQERISGIPYNPPPSSEYWPYNIEGNKAHKKGDEFSHTYPERFWPKNAGTDFRGEIVEHGSGIRVMGFNPEIRGIRFGYGDLNDVVNLLHKEPHTRQAYLPIWFPEDTGVVEGQRVPCTLGYLFRLVDSHIHITYKIRSCDYYRHFRDDIYMAGLLLFDVLYRLRMLDDGWGQIDVGEFKFQADSLHIFASESGNL